MARRNRMRFRQNVNVTRVINKIVLTIIALWVGGIVLWEIGRAALYTCSPFYRGLSIIGWDTGDNATVEADLVPTGTLANETTVEDAAMTDIAANNCESNSYIMYDHGDAGVLTVIGLMGIASVVTEFVEFK